MQRAMARLRRQRAPREPLTSLPKIWSIVRGDEVEVLSGRQAGSRGRVTRVLRARGEVLVEGVNLHTRHVARSEGRMGSKIRVESPISFCAVGLVDPVTHRPCRVRLEKRDGRYERVCVKSGTLVPRPEQLSSPRARPSGTWGPQDTAPSEATRVTVIDHSPSSDL